MLKSLIVVIALFLYTGVLGVQFDDTIKQLRAGSPIPATKYLNWLNLVFIIGFFIFACGTIYLLLTDPTETAYNNAGQLMFFCVIDLGAFWLRNF